MTVVILENDLDPADLILRIVELETGRGVTGRGQEVEHLQWKQNSRNVDQDPDHQVKVFLFDQVLIGITIFFQVFISNPPSNVVLPLHKSPFFLCFQ